MSGLMKVRFPRGRFVHYGLIRWDGKLVSSCASVPEWHTAEQVDDDEPITCIRCAEGRR